MTYITKSLCLKIIDSKIQIKKLNKKKSVTNMQNPIDSLVSEIIETKGFPGLTPEVKAQLTTDLRSKLLDQIDRAVIAALPESSVNQLNQILDNGGGDAEVQRIISESGVNVKQVTLATIMGFRSLYLGDKA